MSEANVEIAKEAIDAFNRRDIDLLIEVTTPDFEWLPALPGAVEGGSYRGRDGIETYLAEVRETWDEQQVIAEEFRDLGDRVLVLGRIEGHGRGSGVPVNAPQGIIFDVRGGKVSYVRAYLDHGEALRAVGLSE